MTATEATQPTKLSDLIPARTSGALPSSRTERLLTEALESDDINTVKAQLVHVWGHYQALEFFLSGVTANKETLQAALDDPALEHDIDPLDLAIGFFATGAVDIAYDAAHQTGMLTSLLGMTVPQALRMMFDYLDHSDPEREEAEAAHAPIDLDA